VSFGHLKGLAELPGPGPTPIVGQWGNFLRFARDPIGYLDELAGHGNPAIFSRAMTRGVFDVGSRNVPGTVFAYGPEHLGLCLNSAHAQYRSIHIRPPPGPAFSTLTWGVQRLHGGEHRRHRKMIAPAFHGKRLDGYRDQLVVATDHALATWRSGQVVDIVAESKRIILEFLNRAFLGLDDADGMLPLGDELQAVWASLFSIPVRIPLRLPMAPQGVAIARAERILASLRDVVARRRGSGSEGDDMLSMLIAAQDDEGAPLTNDELMGHLSFLIFAGFESTVHAVAFACYLIAQHPDVAARLDEEATSVLGGAPPRVAEFDALPFLDMVIRESLRLLSPVPFLLRTAEDSLALAGYEVPPKTEVILSIYHTHRMPEIYAEPRRFRPERWETLVPTSYEYMPFSVGPHMCAGRALALMEMKILLAMILQRFRLALPERKRIDRQMLATLGPRGGMPMRVETQDRQFFRSRGDVGGHVRAMVDVNL
jgi:cytochrome P450